MAKTQTINALTSPDDLAVAQLHAFMRGSVAIPADFDLTAPVADEPFDADKGALHAG